MLLIDCPWCGPRDEIEFGYGGEAHRIRPADPQALSDEEWAAFLFMRHNFRGAHKERWVHSHGCRRWFNIKRNTVTYEILKVYPMAGAEPEAVPAEVAPAAKTGTS